MTWGHRLIEFLSQFPTYPVNDILVRKFREVSMENQHMTVMWYCQGQQIVLVGMEHHRKRNDYLAGEESINCDPPFYFSENGHYISPVYQLKQLRAEVEKLLQSQRLLHYTIWIVYVTNNRIINKSDMSDDVWLPDRVITFDHVLDVTPNFCVESLPKVQTGLEAFQYAYEHTKWMQEDDDFDKALEDFINSSDHALEDEVYVDEDDDDLEEDEPQDEEEDIPDKKGLFDFTMDDLDKDFPFSPSEPSAPKEDLKAEILPRMENPEMELKELTGCQEIREQIRQLTTLHQYNIMRRDFNPRAPLHAVNLHAVFHGAPGTGKTTLCRLYASLLYKAGALTSGHVVVASRSTFLGTNFGDEEKAVRAVLEAAKGGVLMIDEAYLLNPPHPNDPGKHVLQLMMPVLADENMRDIAIVLCGYSEPMERLLNLNDGLASRFPNRFKFPEFSVDQLLDISKQRVKTFNYHFTPKAWKLYKEVVTSVYEHRNKRTWSNAREVAQLLEKIYIHHAKRCMTAPDPKKVLAITVADIRPLVTSFSFTPQHRIGFR